MGPWQPLLYVNTLADDGNPRLGNGEPARTIVIMVDTDARTRADDNILIKDCPANHRVRTDPNPFEQN